MGNLINDYLTTHGNLPVQSPNNSAPTNFNGENKIDLTSKLDSASFLEMYSTLKTNKELSNNGLYISEGKLNGQDSCLKTVYDYSSTNRKTYREGVIGDKKIELTSTANIDKNNISIAYKGQYNNKDVDLTLSYSRESKFKEFYNKIIKNRLYIPDNLTISGTIDNKPYTITVPDVSVPKDADTKDLVTLMLETNSFCPAVIGGKIVAIQPGKSIVHNWKDKTNKRQEFFRNDIKPLISQALSTALGAILGVVVAKFTGKKA